MRAMPAGRHTRSTTSSWNGTPADPLGDHAEHDEAAVAVGEPLAGRGRLRVPAEDREVVVAGREVLDGDRHRVVVDVAPALLVEVVADARAVGEEVLDRDPVVDQREVVAEHVAGRRVERQRPSSTRAMTVRAVKPLAPLATPNRVSTVLGMPWARSASPNATASSIVAGAVDPHRAGEALVAGRAAGRRPRGRSPADRTARRASRRACVSLLRIVPDHVPARFAANRDIRVSVSSTTVAWPDRSHRPPRHAPPTRVPRRRRGCWIRSRGSRGRRRGARCSSSRPR